jgi:hypothetical protein
MALVPWKSRKLERQRMKLSETNAVNLFSWIGTFALSPSDRTYIELKQYAAIEPKHSIAPTFSSGRQELLQTLGKFIVLDTDDASKVRTCVSNATNPVQAIK